MGANSAPLIKTFIHVVHFMDYNTRLWKMQMYMIHDAPMDDTLTKVYICMYMYMCMYIVHVVVYAYTCTCREKPSSTCK